MSRKLNWLGLTALALVAGVTAQAQTTTTGAINGMVRDANGKPLAGATVTVTSAQITRTAMTDAEGSYRLALLTPGEWNVKASKGGQTAPSQRISVLLNNATTVNLKLASEASATVTIVTAAAALDPTTTQTGSVIQMETLSAVPTQRDFNQLVLLAPGTQSGGLMGGQSISGSSAIENNFVIDGLDTTDYRLGFQGSNMPTDFIDQVEIQTGGFRPEYSALGGVVNAITKSGTNQFAGSAWFTNDMAQMAGRPERNNYYQQTPANYRYDFGFTAGGAMIPDKLFYFVGFNQVNTETVPNTNLSGLTDSPQTSKYSNFYAKFNYYITQSQQLTGTIQTTRDPIDQPHQFPTSLGNRDFGFSSTDNATNWSLNYDWTINPALLFSIKYGASVTASHTTPTNASPSIIDYNWFVTGPGQTTPVYGGTHYGQFAYRHGGSGDWNDTTDSNNQQFRMDLSYFLGNHAFKFGYSHNEATSNVVDYLNQDDRVTLSATRTTVVQYANLGSSAKLTYDAFYAQDQWEIKPGLRFSYGFREEYQKITGTDGQTIFNFNNFWDQLQPRLGVTWDINNDGKSKLSFNAAIYNERFPMQAALRTGGLETYKAYIFSKINTGRYGGYYDPNYSYDPATGGYTHSPISNAFLYADYSGYFRADPQPLGSGALKVPKREEFILGFDHTFDSGWTAGIHGKYRNLLRMIEDTVPTDNAGNPIDGQGFSILWNPKYGKTYTWANNQYHPDPGALNTWTNTEFPNPKNVYGSIDLTLEKKTDRYTLSANYTYSHLYGNYEGVGQTSNGQSDANITSTWDYAPYVGNGNLPLDRRHIFKVYGSYTWDLWKGQFSAGGSLIWQSGTPRTYFDDGTATLAANPEATTIGGLSTASGLDWGSYGNATPLNFNYGTWGTTPSTAVINLHFDYLYKFQWVRLMPSIDIFNAGNSRTITSYDDFGTAASTAVPNPAVGFANGWLPGRYIRWGVKVTF
jgi:outer membrane receptor protein involved in Fe transport